MGAQVRVVVHRAEIARLLKGEGHYLPVRVDLLRRAHAVAEQAGPGHGVEEFVGHDRVRAHVYADTFQAKAAEQRDRNLTRALGAAR